MRIVFVYVVVNRDFTSGTCKYLSNRILSEHENLHTYVTTYAEQNGMIRFLKFYLVVIKFYISLELSKNAALTTKLSHNTSHSKMTHLPKISPKPTNSHKWYIPFTLVDLFTTHQHKQTHCNAYHSIANNVNKNKNMEIYLNSSFLHWWLIIFCHIITIFVIITIHTDYHCILENRSSNWNNRWLGYFRSSCNRIGSGWDLECRL